MASERSQQLHDGVRKFALEPAITKKSLQSAVILEQKPCKAFKAKKSTDDTKGVSTHVVPSSKCSEKDAKMSHYKEILSRDWKSFDEFIQHRFQLFWIIRIKKKQKTGKPKNRIKLQLPGIQQRTCLINFVSV